MARLITRRHVRLLTFASLVVAYYLLRLLRWLSTPVRIPVCRMWSKIAAKWQRAAANRRLRRKYAAILPPETVRRLGWDAKSIWKSRIYWTVATFIGTPVAFVVAGVMYAAALAVVATPFVVVWWFCF